MSLTISGSTNLQTLNIPYLPVLLEERFGLLYWQGGHPLRTLPNTVSDLAEDLRLPIAEVVNRLLGLMSETKHITIKYEEAIHRLEQAGGYLLDVSIHSEPAFFSQFQPYYCYLYDHFLPDLLPKLRKQQNVFLVAKMPSKAVSAALYFKNLGVEARAVIEFDKN